MTEASAAAGDPRVSRDPRGLSSVVRGIATLQGRTDIQVTPGG
jgi:hypothetical protein